MTEEEWLVSEDIYEMMLLVYRPTIPGINSTTNRKAILFGAACGSRLLPYVCSRVGNETIRWVELKADGLPTKRDSYSMANSLDRASRRSTDEAEKRALSVIDAARVTTSISNAPGAVWQVANRAARIDPPEARRTEEQAQALLLRDIFGNPFRPVTFALEWRTSTVVSLAQQMYESRDFSAMPILADALQDAGCDSEDILSHCRGLGPHVRGCWVVDFILGKE